jgi:hypothetical protein
MCLDELAAVLQVILPQQQVGICRLELHALHRQIHFTAGQARSKATGGEAN